MGQSVLVFISHSSADKSDYIEPIVQDLEESSINIWLDKRKILPGDNLRKSVFRDGLDKADIALIFFTEESLKSSWVDKEIKHVLREETKKGNNFDLSKIISIFDSKETYNKINERYPELTDDLLHFMPKDYSKIQLGQLISAIWSKYLSLQGDDLKTQKVILDKDKEIFQKEKEINELQERVKILEASPKKLNNHGEFDLFIQSGRIDSFIKDASPLKRGSNVEAKTIPNAEAAIAFGLIESNKNNGSYSRLSDKGKEFLKYCMLYKDQEE